MLTLSTPPRRYGSIRQVRRGTEGKAKGTAFVVYEDVMDVSTRHLPVAECCVADRR